MRRRWQDACRARWPGSAPRWPPNPLQRALDAWLRRALLGIIEARRHEAGELIAETVRRWDTGTVTERIERAIGRDLQYIRINGTLIGGLVGVGIQLLSCRLGKAGAPRLAGSVWLEGENRMACCMVALVLMHPLIDGW
jgi:hypothetical protein